MPELSGFNNDHYLTCSLGRNVVFSWASNLVSCKVVVELSPGAVVISWLYQGGSVFKLTQGFVGRI